MHAVRNGLSVFVAAFALHSFGDDVDVLGALGGLFG